MFLSAVLLDWAFPWEVFGWWTDFITFIVVIFLLTQFTPSYTYIPNDASDLPTSRLLRDG
jgi:hypothetical protein